MPGYDPQPPPEGQTAETEDHKEQLALLEKEVRDLIESRADKEFRDRLAKVSGVDPRLVLAKVQETLAALAETQKILLKQPPYVPSVTDMVTLEEVMLRFAHVQAAMHRALLKICEAVLDEPQPDEEGGGG